MKAAAHGAFVVPAAILLVSCGPGTAPPSQPGGDVVLLRLAPAAGSQAVYETVDTTWLTMEAVGDGTMVQTSVQRVTVREAAGDLRLLKIVVESRNWKQIDGTLPAELSEKFGNTTDRVLGSDRVIAADVLGRTHDSVLLEDGVELTLDSMETGTPSGGRPLGTAELPEHPVRVGDSWTDSEVPSEPSSGMILDQEDNTTYRLDSLRVVDGDRHAFISFERELDGTGSGRDPNLGAFKTRVEMTGSGHVELDLESGFMVSRSLLGQATMVYAIGVEITTVTMKTSNRTMLLPTGQRP